MVGIKPPSPNRFGGFLLPIFIRKVIFETKVMTKAEALDFIEKIESIFPLHIENERLCEKEYKEALYQGEQQDRVALLKTLYRRINTRLSSGKKTTAIDERYCKLTENMLYSELSFVLDIELAELQEKIKKCSAE